MFAQVRGHQVAERQENAAGPRACDTHSPPVGGSLPLIGLIRDEQ